jgi:hypothetical protein
MSKISSFTLVNKNTNKLSWVVGIAVFVISIAYVLNTLFIDPAKNVDFGIFRSFNGYSVVGLLFLVIVIGIANWAIESYKWWFMVRNIEDISYSTAVKSVLTGLAIGFITPNRLGDFPGRAIQFKAPQRGKIILMNLLSGYSQFIIICLLALASIFYLPVSFSVFFDSYQALKFIYISIFVLLIVFHAWFLFAPHFFLRLFFKIKYLKRLEKYFVDFRPLSFQENVQIIHFSFLRSMLYTLQLMLIIYFFDDTISLMDLFLYINVYFFILTVAPSFMLNKLGIRESISVMVFATLISNPVIIVVSVLLLWLINQVIPACIGAFILFNRKTN